MTINKLLQQLGTLFSRASSDETRRPDGGTSHYRPLRRKATQPESEPTPAQGQAPAQPPYVHTGFTGMNPPASYGYDPVTAYGTPPYTGAGSFTGKGQGASMDAGQSSYMGAGAFSSGRQDNISYMPGFAPQTPQENQPVHVEHILTVTGLRSCYEAIECMKNGETLIVMLDAIANESESMRCQDMLAGAAFTLNCTVRMLQGVRMALIAPEGVVILPEQPAVRERGTMPEAPVRRAVGAEAPAAGRRERRSGAHAAEWNAARSGELTDYNPYTGAMPVAAGSYGSFGGYGY